MAGRGRMRSIYEGRSIPEPGMMRHGPVPGVGSASHRSLEPLPPSNRVEAKFAAQVSEIERLAGDNHRLASSHVALREDLVAAQLEVQKLRGHIRSIETESAIQIRVLLEKIAKMEVDIRAGESVRKDFHQAHMEAQRLVKAREELMAQIKQATKELDKAHADLKKLPERRAELDTLRQEHQRLRTTFQYEKGLNMDKVEKMQVMEKDLVGMARELEKLRAEVLNAENGARALNPYSGPFMYANPMHPPFVHGNGPSADSYGRPLAHQGHEAAGEGLVPHGVSNITVASTGGGVASTAGGATFWGGAYDAPLPPR